MNNILKVIKVTSILIGTIVGVGVFGLPYVATQTSVGLVVLYLIILGMAATAVHFFYGEVIALSQRRERLVGYVGEFLGDKAQTIAKITVILGRWGALLAYIIVSGHFLEALLGLDSLAGSLIFFILGSLIIFLGLKTLSWIEVLMSIFLLGAMVIIFVVSIPEVASNNLSFALFSSFSPYGVVLFALSGANAIPEMAELLHNKKSLLRISIILGTIIPVILFIAFVIIVAGTTGVNTTPEALVGLRQVLGVKAMIMGLLFGIIALFTSFISIGLNLKKIFWYDLKLNKNASFLLACGFPILIFILGIRNFINTISLVGAIFGGINGIFIVLIYKKAKRRLVLPAILLAVFSLGIIYEIYSGFASSF